MPNYEAIGDVSKTLEARLQDGLNGLPGPPQALLHDLVKLPQTNPPTLTIFLYDIVEDASARNLPSHQRPRQQLGHSFVTIEKPPMALALRYMLTAWAADRLSEHRIIGRALETFYEKATFTGTELFGALANTNEAIKLTLAPIALEDRARVWDAINQPYRLSVNYEVRVVHIDPDPKLGRDVPAVVERVVQPAAQEVVP